MIEQIITGEEDMPMLIPDLAQYKDVNADCFLPPFTKSEINVWAAK
jgi:hypothetical protein